MKWNSSGPTIVYSLRECLILIFSKTTNASSFKVQQGITLGSLYIYTGNDVTGYFQSAVSSFWVMLGSRFLDNGSIDSEKFTVLKTVTQVLHFLFCDLLDCSLAPKMGLKWAYRRSALHIWLILIFPEITNASSLKIA